LEKLLRVDDEGNSDREEGRVYIPTPYKPASQTHTISAPTVPFGNSKMILILCDFGAESHPLVGGEFLEDREPGYPSKNL
jgi:hypothetical protein